MADANQSESVLSDFQIGLIILGALFLLVVWLFNMVQERRVRRSVEQRFGDSRPDVLFEGGVLSGASGERTEPSLAPGGAGESDGDGDAGWASAPVQGAPAAAVATEAVEIDEEINVTVLLAADQPVSGERILAATHALRHAGRQHVTIVGATGDENWTAIRPGGRYETVLVAVQLANRGGPLNEIEFSGFIASVQQAAEQIPASCDVPDMMETIALARALDARCAPLDAMVGINLLREQGSWSGDLVAQFAEENGMVLRADGRFHAVSAEGTSLFALQNGDGSAFRVDTLTTTITNKLTFLLDVPQVGRTVIAGETIEPFTRMANAAQLLAGQLGAVLVDDNARALTPLALATIDRQIAGVYERLEAAGMPAGSPRAMALFG